MAENQKSDDEMRKIPGDEVLEHLDPEEKKRFLEKMVAGPGSLSRDVHSSKDPSPEDMAKTNAMIEQNKTEIDAKKAKELKKKAEKEAKMKKFMEKKQKQTEVKSGGGGAPAETKKAKPEKSKGKDKISVDDLIKNLEKVPAGDKKPTDGILPDAYDPRYVEATWYSWWVKEGLFKPEYGLVSKSKSTGNI